MGYGSDIVLHTSSQMTECRENKIGILKPYYTNPTMYCMRTHIGANTHTHTRTHTRAYTRTCTHVHTHKQHTNILRIV